MQQKKKIPKYPVNLKPEKKPRFRDPVIHGGHLAWRFSGCDREGPFAWGNFETADKFKEVIEKLHEFETKTWQQIIDGGSHPIELERIEKSARDRLAETQRDDIDTLMSLRLTGTNRVWCVRDASIMRILWWDPDHKVCPSALKGT